MKTSQHPLPPLFQKNEVLFGHAGEPGLIALEIDGDDKVKIFSRDGDKLSSERVPFEPFMLLAGDDGLKGWQGEAEIEVLDGGGAFNRLACFPTKSNSKTPRVICKLKLANRHQRAMRLIGISATHCTSFCCFPAKRIFWE